MARACRKAPIIYPECFCVPVFYVLISVYDYTQVLFAAALGFFVFDDVHDLLSVMGYVLTCDAGVGMFEYNKRR